MDSYPVYYKHLLTWWIFLTSTGGKEYVGTPYKNLHPFRLLQEAPLPNKKENLSKRLKRHETRVHALKKGNALLMANVDRLKDDVLKQREESVTLQKELDSLIDDLE